MASYNYLSPNLQKAASSLGLNTSTGRRNAPAPKQQPNQQLVQTLRDHRDIRDLTYEINQFNNKYDIDRLDRLANQNDALNNAYGQNAFNVKHQATMQKTNLQNAHELDKAGLQMQDNNANRLNDYAKGSLEADTRRFESDNSLSGTRYQADTSLAGTKYNADTSFAGTKYQADTSLKGSQIEADSLIKKALIDAEAQKKNTILGAYSNLYSQYMQPRGDYRYW